MRLYASGFVVKNKELATTGPYGMVRHPLYTGNILMLVGYCHSPTVSGGRGRSVHSSSGSGIRPAISYEDRKAAQDFR